MGRFLVFLALVGFVAPVTAASAAGGEIESIHFLIPGGAGGGWDGTARGGGKALNYMISTAKCQQGTLMVNSTPIIIRSLTGVFPQSFRDLTSIAA